MLPTKEMKEKKSLVLKYVRAELDRQTFRIQNYRLRIVKWVCLHLSYQHTKM